MDSGHDKKRMNNNNNIERAADGLHSKNRKIEKADRLSSLPNDLIHKILSFISIKDTVETMVLSSRYRFIWTTMPYLNFSTQDFPRLQKFSKFVNHFLSRRNSQIDVSSLKLTCGKLTQPYFEKLMKYAFSHNIQQLDVACLVRNDIEVPLSLFSSMSLKHLSLKGKVTRSRKILRATSTLELLALTTLCLQDVTFRSDDHTDSCVGLLSKCANLKNLTLKSCETEGLSSFGICHPGLSNLTIDDGLDNVEVVNVVAPQLQNLTIIRCYDNSREHVISAPNLSSLAYRGDHPLHLSTDGFHSLKEADICVLYPNDTEPHQMVCLLQQLHNVKFLTLNLEIVEFLSSSMELISHQPSPFVNLKSLTIYPKKLSEWEMWGLPRGKVNLSTEGKNYLLDSSPGATFTIFSREFLSSSMELISHQPSPFVNLKSLTIYPKKLSEWEMWGLPRGKVNLSTEGKNYLLDSSPGATFTMFSREEIIAVASAQKLMAELRVLLEQEEANTKTKGKAPMEIHNGKMHKLGKAQPEMKMQPQIGENIALIKGCWNDLSVQFEERKAKACLIISKLESIEKILTKLPASNRAMIQPCFSSLCAEADIVMSKITDCMKIQCDENQNRLSVCFHELATSTTLEPSS